MPNTSLSKLVKSIAKKGKISISPPRGSSPVSRAQINSVRIASPLSRPCGIASRGQKNRYTKEELVALARASGVNPNQRMDSLCAALGISPHQAMVDVPSKRCDSQARGDNRYTRDEVKRLAKARGIPLTGKTMTELCQRLGIERDQVAPRPAPSDLFNASFFTPSSDSDMKQAAEFPSNPSPRRLPRASFFPSAASASFSNAPSSSSSPSVFSPQAFFTTSSSGTSPTPKPFVSSSPKPFSVPSSRTASPSRGLLTLVSPSQNGSASSVFGQSDASRPMSSPFQTPRLGSSPKKRRIGSQSDELSSSNQQDNIPISSRTRSSRP